MNEDKETYKKIDELFDLQEEIMDAIEHEEVVNTEEQLDVAEPFLAKIGESAQKLTEIYVDFIKSGKKATPKASKKVDEAIRNIYIAINNFKKSANKNLVKTIKDKEKQEEIDIEMQITSEQVILDSENPDAGKGDQGPIQKELVSLAKLLGKKYGALLVRGVKKVGDHTLFLSRRMKRLHELGDPDLAIPNKISRKELKKNKIEKKDPKEKSNDWVIGR